MEQLSDLGPEQLGVTMYTVILQCEIPEERTLTVKLPDRIQPGMHEVMVIVDEVRAKPAWAGKGEPMRYAGAIPAFAEVDGLGAQRVMREEWQ